MAKTTDNRTTDSLNEALTKTNPEDLDAFLEANAEKMLTQKKPFAAFMREKFREKSISQQRVFLAADISENYGYKLISEEKHTRQRDTILRLCLAAEFSLEEAQKALRTYNMPILYPRVPRDAVFIIAFNRKIYDIHKVDILLTEHNMPPLLPVQQ